MPFGAKDLSKIGHRPKAGLYEVRIASYVSV